MTPTTPATHFWKVFNFMLEKEKGQKKDVVERQIPFQKWFYYNATIN